MTKFSSVGPLMMVCACVACAQVESGVEYGSVDLNLVLSDGNVDAPVDGGTRATNSLSAETALAFVRHIEFYLPEGHCVDSEPNTDAGDADCEDKLRVEGPWVVDLMTGKATPSMDDIRVPAGAYRRVDVRFEDADKNAAKGIDVPAELEDWTLVSTGAYHGDVAAKFAMNLKFNEDARFQSDSGIVVTADGAREMLMALDVQRWFSAVSLEECFEKERLAVADDTLIIEDESKRCNAVENAIKEVMKHPHRLED
jgi:hypothetical protein